jgi:hypothetical protein
MPASLDGHEVVFAESQNPPAATVQGARAQCPPGTGVIAGGYALSNTGVEDVVILASHPVGEMTFIPGGGPPQVVHDGWEVTARRTDGLAQDWGVLPYAVCATTE